MFEVSAEIRINVRTTEDIKRDLETTARLRGLTVSSLVNALVVKAIREEKAAEPAAFHHRSSTVQVPQPLGKVPTSGVKFKVGKIEPPRKKQTG